VEATTFPVVAAVMEEDTLTSEVGLDWVKATTFPVVAVVDTAASAVVDTGVSTPVMTNRKQNLKHKLYL
jgi:hypothetical protein